MQISIMVNILILSFLPCKVEMVEWNIQWEHLLQEGRSLGSLVGVTVHEFYHSWFQGVLATNEALYAWMDEGFTSFASAETMLHIFDRESDFPYAGSYRGYYGIVESGLEEPLTTHADHFTTNRAYGSASYSKGAVYLAQLGYVIGDDALRKGMLTYFDTWKMKAPNSSGFSQNNGKRIRHGP